VFLKVLRENGGLGGASFSVGLMIGPERRPGEAVFAEPGCSVGPMISPERCHDPTELMIGQSFARVRRRLMGPGPGKSLLAVGAFICTIKSSLKKNILLKKEF
jgi:hypothetical protein